MLHLNAGIHLHKIEFSRLFQKKFNGSGIHIMSCFCGFHSSHSHLVSQFFGHCHGRGFLDHFLMVSLDRTIPFSKMNHISLTVCKDLKFNVSWVLHKVLNVHSSIPKCNLGFLLCGEKCQFKFLWGKGCTHAFPAASKGCFYDDRITNSVCFSCSCLHIQNSLCGSRNYRNSSCFHSISGNLFVSKILDHL